MLRARVGWAEFECCGCGGWDSEDAYVVGLAAATLINIGHTSDGLEYVAGPHGGPGGGWDGRG